MRHWILPTAFDTDTPQNDTEKFIMIPKQAVSAAVFSHYKEKKHKAVLLLYFSDIKTDTVDTKQSNFQYKGVRNERKREKTVAGKAQT